MTGNTNKARAVLLAALMVFSVFAGTIALSGSAAAASAGGVTATDTAQDEEVTTSRIAIENVNTSGEEALNVAFSNIGSAEVVDASVSSSASTSDVNVGSNNVSFNATDASSDDVYLTVQWDTSDVTSDRTVDITVEDQSGSITTGSLAISDVSAVNDFAEAGSTFWRGQGVYFEGDSQQTYQIREVDDDGNLDSLVTEFTTDGNGVAVINTDQQTIENGQEYVITTENRDLVDTNSLGVQVGTDSNAENADQYSWEVQQQTLSAEFEDSEVSAASDDPTTTVEIDSNRGSYGLTVSANGLDAAELEEIFNENGQNVIATDTDDETVTIGSASASDELTASFADVDQDDYQFTFEGADTSASAEANITVSDTEGQLSFPESSYSEQRGDVATINAEFQSTDDGYIEIGSEDVGYHATLEVSDGGDGEIGIEMNTFLAGRTADEGDVFSLTEDSQDDDDTIENVTLHTEQLNSPLEAGTYDIAAGTSVDGNTEDDLSTLDLQQRNTEGIQLWTAPANADYDDQEELQSQVNQSNNVAQGDLAVVQLQASGIYGQLTGSDSEIQEQLYNEDNGFMLTIEEASPGANQEAAQMAMNGSAVQDVYTDDANNSLYVVVDTGVSDPADIGAQDFQFDEDEDYTASFEINDDNPLIDEDEDTYGQVRETAEQDFTLTEANAEFDNLNDEDELELPASENAEISGTTTLAPGTELTIRVRSSGSGSSFLLPVDATVTGDRTFSTTVDLNDREVGTEFTALIRQGGSDLTEVDGVVVEQVDTDTPSDETTTSVDETTTSVDETAAPGDETTDTTTSGGDGDGTTTETTQTNTPGFGVVVALVALVAAALLAVRRDN